MKIPSELKICGGVFNSKYSDSILEHSGLLGASHVQYRDLSVKKDDLNVKEFKEETYIHEIFHNIIESLCLFEDNKYEKIVIRLTSCVYMVFSDNNICFVHNFKIPDAIKIGGVSYSIELVDGLYKSPIGSAMSIHHTYSNIKLDCNKLISKELIELRLLVAIMIAINYQFHIFDEEDMESLDAFTNMFYQVLKDNKGLCFCEA